MQLQRNEVLTGLLVPTSVRMQLALNAVSCGKLPRARASLLPAVVVQAGYLGKVIQGRRYFR